LSDNLEALLRAKARKRKKKASEDIADHRKLVIEEIEMLKVVYCIWFVEGGSSNSNNSEILQ
jgi:hypothetical protein